MFLSREMDTQLCQIIPKRIHVGYTSVSRDHNIALPLVEVLVTYSGRINNIINYIY